MLFSKSPPKPPIPLSPPRSGTASPPTTPDLRNSPISGPVQTLKKALTWTRKEALAVVHNNGTSSAVMPQPFPTITGTLLGLKTIIKIEHTKLGADANGKFHTKYVIDVTLPGGTMASDLQTTVPAKTWQACRRYQEFVVFDKEIRELLSTKAVATLVMLPAKINFLSSKFSDDVINERKRGFIAYLESCIRCVESSTEAATAMARFLDFPGTRQVQRERALTDKSLSGWTPSENGTAQLAETPDGQVLSGYLSKRGGPQQSSSFKSIFASLNLKTGSFRYYRTSRPQLLGALDLLNVPLGKVSVLDPGAMGTPSTAFGFSVWTPDRELLLCCEDENDRVIWCKCIKSVLANNKDVNNKRGDSTTSSSSPSSLLPPPRQNKSTVTTPQEQAKRELDQVKYLREDYLITWSDIVFEKKVGGGAFGTVYRAKLWGSIVAAKQLNTSSGGVSPELKMALEKEVGVLSRLRHPNILLYVGASYIETNACMVTEWAGRGSLFDVLGNVSQILDAKTCLGICLAVARGMTYLHSRAVQIIHRDLKSLNVLVTDNFEIKIADFGLTIMRENVKKRTVRATSNVSGASTVDSDFFGTDTVGTAQWMSPEMMEGAKYSRHVDVYAFGVLLTEVFTRKFPFKDKYIGFDFVDAVLETAERPTIPSWLTCQDFVDGVEAIEEEEVALSSSMTAIQDGIGPALLGWLVYACTRRVPSQRPEFSFIVTKLERLLDTASDGELFANYDIPRIIECLDAGDAFDVSVCGHELLTWGHAAAHPMAAAVPSDKPDTATNNRITLQSHADEICRLLIKRLAWGKGTQVTERGGEFETIDLSPTTCTHLACALYYLRNLIPGSSLVTVDNQKQEKDLLDVIPIVVSLFSTCREAALEAIGGLLASLRNSSKSLQEAIDRAIDNLLQGATAAGGAGVTNGRTRRPTVDTIDRELLLWRAKLFGLGSINNKAGSPAALGLGRDEVLMLESEIRSLEVKLTETRRKLWSMANASVREDMTKV